MIETDRQEVVREDRQKAVLERDIAVVNRADHRACNIFECRYSSDICHVDPLISIAREIYIERERERERERREEKKNKNVYYCYITVYYCYITARFPFLRTEK